MDGLPSPGASEFEFAAEVQRVGGLQAKFVSVPTGGTGEMIEDDGHEGLHDPKGRDQTNGT